MKKLLCVTALLVATLGLLAAADYSSSIGAKKIVSVVHSMSWDSDQGWVELEATKTIVQVFDDQGRPVSQELYYEKTKLIEKTVYAYEADLVKTTTANHENKVIRFAVVKKEGSTLTETVSRADGSPLFQYVSTLDGKGRVMELVHRNAQGAPVFRKMFLYGDKDELVGIRHYNPDGSLAVYISIRYDKRDERGNWLISFENYTYADVYGRPRDVVYRTIEY